MRAIAMLALATLAAPNLYPAPAAASQPVKRIYVGRVVQGSDSDRFGRPLKENLAVAVRKAAQKLK